MNLSQLKNEHWLESFPRGANLLSYLYKILLSCEADYQLNALLRKLFSQSCVPLLKMAEDFLNQGHFEDPYNEFFVSSQREFCPDKVPCFLERQARQIHKTGCLVA